MDLHPTSLSVVAAVARTGSVTRAAESLHLTQPAVSYHIKKIEERFGTPMFRRGAGGMTPTAAGERLIAGAERVLAEMDRVVEDVRSAIRDTPETLRLSSACFTNYHWLPGVIAELGDDVRVELDVDQSRRPFEQVDRGDLDLALTTDPPRRGPFRLVELFDDEIVAVTSPESPLAAKAWLEPEDFADQTVFVFDRTRSDLFTRVLNPAGVTPRRVRDVPATEAILDLVEAGRGVSPMASWVARPRLLEGTLHAARIGREGLGRTWCAVLSDRRRTPDLVERFLEVLARGPGGF